MTWVSELPNRDWTLREAGMFTNPGITTQSIPIPITDRQWGEGCCLPISKRRGLRLPLRSWRSGLSSTQWTPDPSDRQTWVFSVACSPRLFPALHHGVLVVCKNLKRAGKGTKCCICCPAPQGRQWLWLLSTWSAASPNWDLLNMH